MRTLNSTSRVGIPGGLRGAGRAFNTERTYAGRIALYLSYCRGHGVDWARPGLAQLMAMMRWLADEPVPSRSRKPGTAARYRSEATANANRRGIPVVVLPAGLGAGDRGQRVKDMHLLPDSRALGCRHEGPHVHVRRRLNANGAFAKAREPRVIPVGENTIECYARYQYERDEVEQAAGGGPGVREPVPCPAGSADEVRQRL
ncbi:MULTISPECIES: hypothetical protein [unclassified Nonomuraea]|uniref:hypothetical protein n=1 Tax=unclassified Nonomuraea TaxID=2593643 RepID=UPI0033D1FCEA